MKQSRIILIGMVFFVAPVIIFIVVSVLTASAKITITTNGDNDISVTPVNQTSKNAQTVEGNSKLVAHLHSGNYTVDVSSQSFASQRIITVHNRQNQTININLDSIGLVEPVANQAAVDPSVGGDSINYINLNNGSLMNIDSQSNENVVDGSHDYVSASWANSSYGIVQDSSNNLYLLNSGKLTPLNLPIKVTQNNYSISPNKQLYISDGNNVYEGTPGGVLNEVYKSNTKVSITGAGNNGALVTAASTLATADEGGSLKVITSSGKTYSTNGGAYSAAWSPDGNYVVVTSDSATAIYNDQLKSVGQIGTANITSPVWVNDQTILYGVASGLWSYNVQSKSSNLLASVNQFGYVSQLTPSPDGSYVYVLIQNTQVGSGYQLGRFGLQGQTVSNSLQQIQIILPNTYSGCSFGYVNFTKTNILVSGTPQSGPSCEVEAQQYFNSYSVDFSQFIFTTTN